MVRADGCPAGHRRINDECWKKIGVIGVDSGQVLITDPGYIDSGWKNEDMPLRLPHGHEKYPKPKHNMSYYACCEKTLTGLHGQLNYNRGHPGLGVVSTTGFGDGSYNVYALINNHGKWGKRVEKIMIDFIEE